MHRDLGVIMWAALCDDPNASWEDILPQALFTLRTAVCLSTGFAPYQLLLGRDCSTPIDLLFGRPEEDDINKGGRGRCEADAAVPSGEEELPTGGQGMAPDPVRKAKNSQETGQPMERAMGHLRQWDQQCHGPHHAAPQLVGQPDYLGNVHRLP